MLSGCHGAFDSPLRGLRLPDRPGLPGVLSALMRHVRAPTSPRCPSKRAPALTSCLDRLLEGFLHWISVRRYLRHERMGVFRPSLWFHRSPTGHSPREPRISRAFTSAARATAQEVVALAGLASIHPPSCGRSGGLVRRSKDRLLCQSMLGIACCDGRIIGALVLIVNRCASSYGKIKPGYVAGLLEVIYGMSGGRPREGRRR